MMGIELERTAQIWGITGNLGGGKTLSAVHFAVNAMAQGYFVVSNITLDVDNIAADYGDWTRSLYLKINLDEYIDFYKLPCGSPRGSGGGKRVLVILDECAEWIDQYSSAKDPKIARMWSWLRHSSKRSQDVFIIVQRPEYLNKVVRILISRWMYVNDMGTFRFPVFHFTFPFLRPFVERALYDRQGRRISPITFIRKKSWGRYYNTAECLNVDGAQYNVEYKAPPRRQFPFSFTFAFWLWSLYLVLRQ